MSASATMGAAGELRSQLERARLGLQRVERDIRKVAVQHQVVRNPDRNFQANVRGGGGGGGPRLGNSRLGGGGGGGFPDDDRFSGNKQTKRPQETKTVFSRLSARPVDDDDDSDNDEEDAPPSPVAAAPPPKKPRLSSQVTRDLPTKQEVLKAQEGDEQSKARNRRMFGSLLGTLQKFKQESIVRQNKEDRRAQIERKIEEQARLERESRKRERQGLFAEREIKKATVRALEAKMVRVREFERWEAAHAAMLGFVQTRGKPHVFWRPKTMSDGAREKWKLSREKLEKIIEQKRQDVAAELSAIEQRCLRNMKLPPSMQGRVTSLFDDSATLEKEGDDKNERLVVKKEGTDDGERLKKDDDKVENGKGEKWNREESDGSSSDENDNSPRRRADDKDHSMDESSRANENGEEDPGGVPTGAEETVPEETSMSATNDNDGNV